MNLPQSIGLAAAMSLLAGCATIFDGTTQKIAISTSPPGARCELQRKGEKTDTFATVEKTPGVVKVSKTKYGILVVCNLAGYSQITQYLKSGRDAATYGDLAMGLAVGGGLIGHAVDSATGAANKYAETVNLTFTTLSPSVAQTPPPNSTTATGREGG